MINVNFNPQISDIQNGAKSAKFTDLSLSDLATLAQVLKGNTTLLALEICKSNFSDPKAHGLLADLIRHSVLTTLIVSDCQLGPSNNLEVLAPVFSESQTLTTVKLPSNMIGPMGIPALARELAKSKSIKEVDLSDNNFDPRLSPIALRSLVAETHSIISLDLTANTLGYEGSAAIAQGLRQNSTITSLATNHVMNNLTAVAIQDCLLKNKALPLVVANQTLEEDFRIPSTLVALMEGYAQDPEEFPLEVVAKAESLINERREATISQILANAQKNAPKDNHGDIDMPAANPVTAVANGPILFNIGTNSNKPQPKTALEKAEQRRANRMDQFKSTFKNRKPKLNRSNTSAE